MGHTADKRIVVIGADLMSRLRFDVCCDIQLKDSDNGLPP